MLVAPPAAAVQLHVRVLEFLRRTCLLGLWKRPPRNMQLGTQYLFRVALVVFTTSLVLGSSGVTAPTCTAAPMGSSAGTCGWWLGLFAWVASGPSGVLSARIFARPVPTLEIMPVGKAIATKIAAEARAMQTHGGHASKFSRPRR